MLSLHQGANDGFLVNPPTRWRGREWLIRVALSRSTEIGGLSQKGGERSFADPTDNGEVAPITAVRGATVEPRRSTQSRQVPPSGRQK